MGLKCSQLENLSKGVCAKMKRKQLGTRTNSEEHFSSHFQQQSMVCSLDTKQNSFAEDDTDGSFINCNLKFSIVIKRSLNKCLGFISIRCKSSMWKYSKQWSVNSPGTRNMEDSNKL